MVGKSARLVAVAVQMMVAVVTCGGSSGRGDCEACGAGLEVHSGSDEGLPQTPEGLGS